MHLWHKWKYDSSNRHHHVRHGQAVLVETVSNDLRQCIQCPRREKLVILLYDKHWTEVAL